ncbi:hypothetical protein ScPMuIL_013562 [Solemya velum]
MSCKAASRNRLPRNGQEVSVMFCLVTDQICDDIGGFGLPNSELLVNLQISLYGEEASAFPVIDDVWEFIIFKLIVKIQNALNVRVPATDSQTRYVRCTCRTCNVKAHSQANVLYPASALTAVHAIQPPQYPLSPPGSDSLPGPYSILNADSTNSSQQKRKRSWSRAVFSNLQRKGLEKRFAVQKYVTKPDRRQLAAMLGLTDAQVKVWFQNRRMKWRQAQQQTEDHISDCGNQTNNATDNESDNGCDKDNTVESEHCESISPSLSS